MYANQQQQQQQQQANKSNSNDNKHTITIELNEHLTHNIKFNLIENLIKYLLCQRCQIPISYETLKQELQQTLNNNNTAIKQQHRKLFSISRNNDFIQKIEQIFTNFKQLLTSNTTINMRTLLIIIGGSIVTPKEQYYLHLNQQSTQRFHGHSQTANGVEQCRQKFFKALFLFLQTIDFKDLQSSPIYVLFECERSFDVNWFLPKLNYTPPINYKSSKQIHINVETCASSGDCETGTSANVNAVGDDDSFFDCSTTTSANFDISGIEPLNQTFERCLNLNNKQSQSKQEQQQQQQEFIWYQSPTVPRGIK